LAAHLDAAPAVIIFALQPWCRRALLLIHVRRTMKRSNVAPLLQRRGRRQLEEAARFPRETDRYAFRGCADLKYAFTASICELNVWRLKGVTTISDSCQKVCTVFPDIGSAASAPAIYILQALPSSKLTVTKARCDLLPIGCLSVSSALVQNKAEGVAGETNWRPAVKERSRRCS